MRKSVLTGVLACGMVFLISGGSAEAAPASALTNKEQIPVLELIDSISGDIHQFEQPLASQQAEEEENNEQVAPEEPAQPEPVVHTIGEVETLSSIAREYDTTWRRIYDKNPELENPDVIEPGVDIVIPEPEEQLEQRELPVVEPVVSTSTQVISSVSAIQNAPRGSSAGNTYVRGQCTWYAKSRRPDLPNNLGNARTWYQRAAAQGLPVGQTPRAGAIGQWKGRNHVVYIESVNGDGTVTVTDMNWSGPYQITTRTVPATDFNYIY